MRISEIMSMPEAADPFKPQADALKRQQQELRKKKARLKVQKAQAALGNPPVFGGGSA